MGMNERERVEAKLAELVGTPADVAAKLRENGVRGRQNEPDTCVIARWIDREVWKRDISHADVYYFVDFGVEKEIVLAPHLQQFVALFDAGEFPDLID